MILPHLNKYSNCDDSPTVLGKDVLLHEYTRSLDRSTSACVKTVTRRWQKDAPEIYETLDLPTRDEECLLLEMCATLELHDHATDKVEEVPWAWADWQEELGYAARSIGAVYEEFAKGEGVGAYAGFGDALRRHEQLEGMLDAWVASL